MRRVVVVRATAALLAGGLIGWGCGGDEERTALTETQRTASPALTSEPTTASTTSTTGTGQLGTAEPEIETVPSSTAPSGGLQAPEEQEGGAGDETAARTPITIAIDGDGVTPRVSRVPPFLGVKLTLRSRDGAAHSVRIATVPDQFEVPANGAGVSNVGGLQPGTYAVLVDGRSTDAVLRVGTGG